MPRHREMFRTPREGFGRGREFDPPRWAIAHGRIRPMSESEAFFQGLDAVAGDFELGALWVFDTGQQAAAGPGLDLVEVVDVEQGAAVDAGELRGIEL